MTTSLIKNLNNVILSGEVTKSKLVNFQNGGGACYFTIKSINQYSYNGESKESCAYVSCQLSLDNSCNPQEGDIAVVTGSIAAKKNEDGTYGFMIRCDKCEIIGKAGPKAGAHLPPMSDEPDF